MNPLRDHERLRFTSGDLVHAWFDILPQFEAAYPGSTATITATGGYRDPTAQEAALASGTSPFNGTTSFSKHQKIPVGALDWEVEENGAYVADGKDERYAWIGQEFEKRGFIWGGRFHHPRPDWDHVETPGPNPNKAEVEASLQLFKDQTATA